MVHVGAHEGLELPQTLSHLLIPLPEGREERSVLVGELRGSSHGKTRGKDTCASLAWVPYFVQGPLDTKENRSSKGKGLG